MKKIYFALAIGISSVAFAQKGKIGVNNTAPQATLDIQVKVGNTDTNEGILIPRVNKARVKAILSGNRVEGTLVYVTDAVEDSDNATFTGTGKGFYYYDAATQKWVKMGSGAATAPAPEGSFTRNIRVINSASVTATTDDYMLINEYSGTVQIFLPTAPPDGRTICGFNTNTSQDVQWKAGTGDAILGANTIYGGSGTCLIYSSDKKTWYTFTAG